MPSLSFPLPSALRLLRQPALRDLRDPGGPAHPRRRDSRREVNAGGAEPSPAAEDAGESGAAGPARVGGGAAARESSRAGSRSSGGPDARAAQAGPGRFPPRRACPWPRRVTQPEHVVRGRASAAPASRERAFQGRGRGRRREQQRQQRRPRGRRGAGGSVCGGRGPRGRRDGAGSI